MQKLVLISSLVMLSLSGCLVVPNRGHDDGYHNDHHHRDDRNDNRDHDGHDDGHDSSYDRPHQYH